jgi:hypothetical protein
MTSSSVSFIRRLGFWFVVATSQINFALGGDLSVADYPSIQQAIDANPGRMIYVPNGDHEIAEKLRLHKNGGGLFGPGRIIQTSANQPIIEIEHANNVQVRDLTLTRPEGRMETANEAIIAIQCHDLMIDNVRVLDNRTRASAISLRNCETSRITNCIVRNYMRLSIDDRTASADWGYAFNCTDGTGIDVNACNGTLVQGNTVIEDNLLPTPEIKARFKLGDFVKKNPKKGNITNQQMWDANHTDAWQQGSAIVINSPEANDFTRIIGNHIENAAQGMDLHCDHVIVSQNIVTNAFIGMKAMHGSRNVLITGNQFSRNDLWAIGLMPGAASHPALPGKPETENADGGSIISNNIISDFGHGHAHWIWGCERSPIRFDTGQQPDDPPLTDVIIQGNVVHCIGDPLYKYAVIIPGGPNAPRGLHFATNIFAPGTAGVANRELTP